MARTYTNKHGLKDLINELLGIELDKSSQSSDWGSNEDLTKDQLDYAANDVRYLIEAMHKLKVILERENRYELAQKCFETVSVHDNLDSLALQLNTSSEQVSEKVSQLIETNKSLKQEVDKLKSSNLSATASDLSLEFEEIEGIKVFAHKMEGLDASALREAANQLRNKEKNSLIVLISLFEDKIPIVIARHKDLEKVDARKVMDHMVNLLGGSGGGRSDFSQGGIENVEDIGIALASLSEFLVSLNS